MRLSLKILPALIFGCLFFSQTSAQVLTNNQTIPTISGRNPFLDASTNFDKNLSDNSTGKGLVFPRTDLTLFEFVNLEELDGIMFPSAFDGMIVYNVGTGDTKAGQGAVVAVKPGFYYFSNPNGINTLTITSGRWLRLTNMEDIGSVPSGPVNPSTGNIADLFYNTTENKLFVYNGTDWVPVDVDTDDQTLSEILTINTSAGSHAISNLTDPTAPQDAATKNYVDSKIGVYTVPSGINFPTVPAPGAGNMYMRTDFQTLFVFNGTGWQPASQQLVEIEISSDGQNNLTGSFFLHSTSLIQFNGITLNSSDWGGVGTSVLSFNIPTKQYDKIVIKN